MESRLEWQLLSAFVDNALDAPQRLLVEQRIDGDPALSEDLRRLRFICAAVRAHATRHIAPAPLASRASRLMWTRTHRAGSAWGAWARIEWTRWFAWRPAAMAACIASMSAWSLDALLWQPRSTEQLMQAAVAKHLQATSGTRLVDFASSNPRTLAPWLATRVSFAAPVLVPDTDEVALVGGRIDDLQGRSVAALVYRLRGHLVDAFVWPTGDDDVPVATSTVRGFNVSHWARNGLRYCVVSDLPKAQLDGLAVELDRDEDLPNE